MNENNTKITIENGKNEIQLRIETNDLTLTSIGDDIEIVKPKKELDQYFVKVKNKNTVDVLITHTFLWCNEIEDKRQWTITIIKSTWIKDKEILS